MLCGAQEVVIWSCYTLCARLVRPTFVRMARVFGSVVFDNDLGEEPLRRVHTPTQHVYDYNSTLWMTPPSCRAGRSTVFVDVIIFIIIIVVVVVAVSDRRYTRLNVVP